MRNGGRDPRSGGGSTTGAVPVGADPVSARTRTGSGEPTARTVTASDGSFQFNLPPGDYLITEDITSATMEVTVTAEKISTVTLTVPGA